MRRLVLIVAMVLVATACGGGETASDDTPADGTSATTTAPDSSPGTSAPETDDGEPGDPAPSDVSGIGEGTVTINGETYLFGEGGFPALQCEPDMFGVFFVVLQQVDASGSEVPDGLLTLTLLLEGTDPAVVGQDNTARLTIGGEDWIADPEDIAERGLDPGTSQVDAYTIDGNTVSGTATFYEEESYYATTGGSTDPIVTAQGTFEVACSGT